MKLAVWIAAAAMAALVSPGAAQVQAQDKPAAAQVASSEADNRYLALVEAAKADIATVDFTELRIAYAESQFYRGSDSDPSNILAEAQLSGEAPKPEIVRKFVDDNFALAGSHLLALVHTDMEKGSPEWDFHLAAFRGLIDAILATGNGRTPETALKVLTVSEEYDFLGAFGLTKVSQALIDRDGKPYDLMVVTPQDGGGEIELYFDISAFFGRY